jgi:hypothetical protein
LQATWIRNSILHALRNSRQVDTKAIPTNFVYSYPTLRLLAEMLTRLAAGSPQEVFRRADAMEFMVQKYTQDFPKHHASAGAPPTPAVLITGTTGALGSHIVAELLALPEITTVYAFNRLGNTDIRERQRRSFAANGIDVLLLESPKLMLLDGNLNEPQFGLSQETFDTLRDQVTLVIHNGNPLCLD